MVIDMSTGTPVSTTTTQPVRAERFTPEHVADDQKLSDQLTRINQLALDATQEARSNVLGQPKVYVGLAITTGAKLTIQHGLGRRAFWWPVGYVDAGAAVCAVLDEDPTLTTTDTLVLRSYVTGTLNLAVA